jgi:hypothetical protein
MDQFKHSVPGSGTDRRTGFSPFTTGRQLRHDSILCQANPDRKNVRLPGRCGKLPLSAAVKTALALPR